MGNLRIKNKFKKKCVIKVLTKQNKKSFHICYKGTCVIKNQYFSEAFSIIIYLKVL